MVLSTQISCTSSRTPVQFPNVGRRVTGVEVQELSNILRQRNVELTDAQREVSHWATEFDVWTKEAHERELLRNAELQQENEAFLLLRGEARTAEAQLAAAYRNVTALEERLTRERQVRAQEMEMLESEMNEQLQELMTLSDGGNKGETAEAQELFAELLKAEEDIDVLSRELASTEMESERMSEVLSNGASKDLPDGPNSQSFPDSCQSCSLDGEYSNWDSVDQSMILEGGSFMDAECLEHSASILSDAVLELESMAEAYRFEIGELGRDKVELNQELQEAVLRAGKARHQEILWHSEERAAATVAGELEDEIQTEEAELKAKASAHLEELQASVEQYSFQGPDNQDGALDDQQELSLAPHRKLLHDRLQAAGRQIHSGLLTSELG